MEHGGEKMIMPLTESPCIGICSTVYGDNICRGCKRDYREVIDWNRYLLIKKKTINQRLQEQIETVTARFIDIESPEQLKLKLMQVALRPLLYDSPLCWAYELLRLKARQIILLSDYGLQAKTPYEMITPSALFTKLDDELYTLAQESFKLSKRLT